MWPPNADLKLLIACVLYHIPLVDIININNISLSSPLAENMTIMCENGSNMAIV